MKEKLTNYDPAEDLGSDEAIAAFMAEAFQTNDAGYISHALGVVARAKGMAQIAHQTGLSREQLYRSFSAQGNPTLEDNACGHERAWDHAIGKGVFGPRLMNHGLNASSLRLVAP
jgi:probable addiction module antidote protein